MKKMNTRLSFLLAGGLLALVICPTFALFGDDRDMFSASTKPNVMLLLDSSRTMAEDTANNNPNPSPGDPGYDFMLTATTTYAHYKTSAGETYSFPFGQKTTGQNKGYYAKRIYALKRVTIQLIDQFRDKVKIGFATFFLRERVPKANNWFIGEGAIIRSGITDLSTSTSTAIDAAHDAALTAMCDLIKPHDTSTKPDTFIAAGGTPLAESLDTLYGYFKGSIGTDTDPNSSLYYNKDNAPRIPVGNITPAKYSCQQNYIIIVSDGYPTNDSFNTRIGTQDTALYSPYSICTFDKRNGYNDGEPPYPTSPSADVQNMAFWMYNNPLYSPQEAGLPNSNIITWAIGMKITGTAKDRLEAAAANGHGLYKSADNFDQLNNSLIDALNAAYYGTFAYAGYTSPKKITTSDENKYVSYTGFFLNKDAPIWEGHLQCLAITPKTNSYEFVELWDAADRMYNKFKDTGWQDRNITTQTTADGAPAFQSKDFNIANAATLTQALGATDATQAGTIIRYILGDMSTTGRKITATSSQFLLADIFHSDTTYVGKPFAWKSVYDVKTECPNSSDASDTDCYKNFYNACVDRTKVLYAGTNDGIIHQINASTATSTSEGGTELRGFIPSQLLPKLKKIAIDKQYTYTADGRLTAADIYSPANKWQTILAYGFRDGAKGIGCFNVSDPENVSLKWNFPAPAAAITIHNFDQGNPAFHFTGSSGFGAYFHVGQILDNPDGTAQTTVTSISNNDNRVEVKSLSGFKEGMQLMLFPSIADYVGYVWCKPVIGRLKYKKGTTTYEKWVIIITGGRSNNDSGNEGKSLFILDADTGTPIWYLAHASSNDTGKADYYKTNQAELGYTVPQSLTAVDLDNDTFIDTIYFGNNGGHLFKLDVSDPLTTNWAPKHMFAGSSTKPIYLSPAVAYDQCYKLWLYFGSGDRNKPQDCVAGQFVAMRDEKYTSNDPYPLTATDTILQKLSWSPVTGTKAYTTSTTTDVTKKGWYFDFLDTSEILFDPDPFIVPDNSVPHLFFNTYERTIPPVEGDPCSTGGNMHVYDITLPSCSSNNSFLLTGLRDLGRIAGHGLFGSKSDLVYINDSKLGDTETKDFKESTLQYPGGVLYFKEITR